MTGSASCARGVPAAVDILTVVVISQGTNASHDNTNSVRRPTMFLPLPKTTRAIGRHVATEIMELDNVLFAVGLPERVRARVETEGRVELTDEEAAKFAISKPVRVLLVMMYLLCAAQAVSKLVLLLATGLFGPQSAFLCGAVIEACGPRGGGLLGVAKAIGSWVLGAIISMAFILTAVSV